MLLAEFLTLFLVLPLALRFSPVQIPPIPLLWLATLYCLLTLKRDPAFRMEKLWNIAALPSQLPGILILFAAIGTVIALGVRRFAPELLFNFVRMRPGLWAVVMILYPVLSVYPQGLVYRAFLMHRYASLLPGRYGTILLSAVAFGFMHLIFRNWLAVSMTFAGGLLFAWRYASTESLAASSFEHALYGCLLFTIGLGQYFYHGRVRL